MRSIYQFHFPEQTIFSRKNIIEKSNFDRKVLQLFKIDIDVVEWPRDTPGKILDHTSLNFYYYN